MNGTIRFAAIGVVLAAATAASAAPAGYMQIRPTKYCSPLGDRDPDAMIKGCEDAIATGMLTHDELAGAWSNLAVAYRKKGDDANALRTLTNAIAVDQNQWYAYVNRIGLYVAEGKYDLAEADCAKAQSLRPDEPAVIRVRGELYIAERKYDLAIAALTTAIERDDRDAKAYGYRAKAYEAQGKTDLAASDRARLVALDPDNALGLMPKGKTP